MTIARQKRKISGFTLVEIIIVIAVLGILAMIAIPRYAGFTLEAKNKVDISNARIMTGIAAAHNASTGSYPSWPVSFDKIELNSNPDAKEYFSGDIEIQNPANSFEYDPATGTVTISGTSVVVSPVPTESDASLQSLTVSAGTLTPAFSSGVTAYSVTLPAGTTTPPTISAAVKVAGASANVSNASSLPGSGSVTVTSKDGTATKTYTVSFTVALAPAPTEYTITFNSNGGSAVSSITLPVGSAITAPADPTRAGYTFTGWSPAVPTTMPEGGATVTANWTPVAPAATTIVISGPSPITSGTGNNTQTYQYSAVVKDQFGNTMSGQSITWSATNMGGNNSISSTGLLSLRNFSSASTTITATAGTATASKVVIVN